MFKRTEIKLFKVNLAEIETLRNKSKSTRVTSTLPDHIVEKIIEKIKEKKKKYLKPSQ